jgi:probable F420-dependent oxidoreductase
MRPFRFGVALASAENRADWAAKCRQAEDLGYDVILVPDHLGMQAPFPALLTAAEATTRARVGTFVLNAGFWNPTLLNREARTADQLSGGRLELGLGAGYARAEFEAAGLPWLPIADRIEHLRCTLQELCAQQAGPPILVGGNSAGILRLCAEYADIVGFSPGKTRAAPGTRRLSTTDELRERVGAFRRLAGSREDQIERNLFVLEVIVTTDRLGTADRLRSLEPELSTEKLLDLPTVLVGTVADIREQLHRWRELLGFSYIAVREAAMAELAPVVAAVAGK